MKSIMTDEPTYYPIMKSIIRRVLHTDKPNIPEIMRIRTDFYCDFFIQKHKGVIDSLNHVSANMCKKQLCAEFKKYHMAREYLKVLMAWTPESQTYYEANENAKKKVLEYYKKEYDWAEKQMKLLSIIIAIRYPGEVVNMELEFGIKDTPDLHYF